MLRAHPGRSLGELALRLLPPLLASLLLISIGAVDAQTVTASSGAMATLRQRQVEAEAAMRRADRQLERLAEQRRHGPKLLRTTRHKLVKAAEWRGTVRARATRLHHRLGSLRLQLARETRVRPDPRGRQTVDRPSLRRQLRAVSHKAAQADRSLARAERRVEHLRALKRAYSHKVTVARVHARRAERERAERQLGAAVQRMVALAKGRADSAGLAAASGFRKPVKGIISQRFGCTGVGYEPARGSCRHYHDGVDIAAARGTTVRAAADGYVAYVGFNPWDRGDRAFIVIIGHARGYATVYGHLQPTRMVRAGQRVHRGGVIGAIGLTGRTSGPHLHWELHRGSRIVDPLDAVRSARSS